MPRRERATPSGPAKSCSSHQTAGVSSRTSTPSASHSCRRSPATSASGSRVRWATLCGSRARNAASAPSSITSYGGAVTASVGRAYRTARNGRTSATARAYTHAVATISELVEDRTVDGVYAFASRRRLTTRGGKPISRSSSSTRAGGSRGGSGTTSSSSIDGSRKATRCGCSAVSSDSTDVSSSRCGRSRRRTQTRPCSRRRSAATWTSSRGSSSSSQRRSPTRARRGPR